MKLKPITSKNKVVLNSSLTEERRKFLIKAGEAAAKSIIADLEVSEEEIRTCSYGNR